MKSLLVSQAFNAQQRICYTLWLWGPDRPSCLTLVQVPDESEEVDDDVMEQLQPIIEQDYELGSVIKDKLVPNAVQWFTGEAEDDIDDYMWGDDDDGEARRATDCPVYYTLCLYAV